MTVRAAVIGLGNKGWKGWMDGLYPKELTHVGAILETEELELAAVADINKDLLAEFVDWNNDEITTVCWSEDGEFKTDPATMNPILAFKDYQKMLTNEDIDVVSIATPIYTHMEIARNVVRFDGVKAVFLEKPIALTIPDAEKVLRTYKDAFKIPCLVNYTRRWHPAWKYARKKILELGHCHTIVGYCNGEPLEAGTHMTDLFNMLAPKAEMYYVDLYQEHSHGGPYQPYIQFEVHAFCPKGKVSIVKNGQIVWTDTILPPSQTPYANLSEIETEWVECFDYNESNIEAQKAAFAELRDLALGKRKKPTCGLGHGVRAMKLLEEEFI